jgi:hypothetical protein
MLHEYGDPSLSKAIHASEAIGKRQYRMHKIKLGLETRLQVDLIMSINYRMDMEQLLFYQPFTYNCCSDSRWP